ncbi:hypothetical protein GLYMA_16G158900v4 [Glycine max]|uniref:Uncharacterized protein n=2 Tax=Glycine subgen. Soja TaxID=1462606 RepID=K7MHM0_SOYBN|nr:hypothetical protein JHK87_045401 [Glycine soja]KAG4952344.1 hypothetical protein JHK85_046211 [Glycine max]KAG5108758.1 hypothetical protein JHK84_045665 [Glycine max]KAH1151633.1 hypothetical protein GYH30_045236 [Glycine max]KRH08584.1 hypothetical protein GLYMA_16G158900v4 [Glycine max]
MNRWKELRSWLVYPAISSMLFFLLIVSRRDRILYLLGQCCLQTRHICLFFLFY